MEGENPTRFRTFREFWPFYVSEHGKPGTRLLHAAGSTVGLAFVTAAVIRARPIYVLYALLAGYGFAWLGHFVIEKNRPATFRYPLWSFLGDWKMYGLLLRGKMDSEAARLDPERGRTLAAGPTESERKA